MMCAGPDFDVRHEAPTLESFIALRSSAGWGEISREQAQLSLQNSLAFAGVYHRDELVAMGRVVGDGALFFYLQDIIVRPDYQGQGCGRAVMQVLEAYLQRAAKPGATIALLAAKGKESFYTAFGYQGRTGSPLGLGMCKFV